MEKTIVIVGGSFNPPTKARLNMVRIFKDRVKADLVLFVPAKRSYMKTWKKYQLDDILPEKTRIVALRSLENDWLKVDTCEVDETVSGASYDTIQHIKEKYHTSKVYFGIGSDKLLEVPRWSNSKELLSNEKFLLLSRAEDNIDSVFEYNNSLALYKNSFLACESAAEPEIKNISSTLAREYLCNKQLDKLKGIVPESVFRVLTENITDIDINK